MSPAARGGSGDGAGDEARRALCRAGRRLRESGLVAGRAGNLSVRVGPDRLLVTPSGAALGRLEPSAPVEVSLAADPGDPTPADATSELPLHRAVHRARDGARAVVHSHPPALTAAGLRGIDPEGALPELGKALGGLAAVAFAPSGSERLARAAAGAAGAGASVLLLRRHGVVALGATLAEAVDRTELAELSAYAVLLARSAGVELDLGRVAELHRRCHRRLEERAGDRGEPAGGA